MGYDYEITYNKGKDNLVVDYLSRRFDDHASLLAISMPIPNWLQSVQQGYVSDSSYLKSSNSWIAILLLYRITLGMVLL